MLTKLTKILIFLLLLQPIASQGDWRNVLEGVGGYPAGNMLEIALRRTYADKKLEMFQWRSEFIAMLGVQPGPLVEREWKTLELWPPMTGAGTWTGMTLWENQQSWHDMANMIFPSPVTQNWLTTINMTLCHVRPNEASFNLRTLAQSGDQVLELGILAYATMEEDEFNSALANYLNATSAKGSSESFTFDFFGNLGGINGPLTTAYNANGPPDLDGSEGWKVYMVVWKSLDDYTAANIDSSDVDSLKAVTVEEHSSIDVVTRSTSLVCCKKDQCVLDPELCNVSVLGMGDTWASNCAQCPKPCQTDYGVCSLLSTQTCFDIGGTVKDSCDDTQSDSSGSTHGSFAAWTGFICVAWLFMSM